MNILVIGGSGLLGSHIVHEALTRGHRVTILSRGTEGSLGDSGGKTRHIQADVYTIPDDALNAVLAGQDGVVYALGIDDRRIHAFPAYPEYHKDHVDVCMRIARKSKEMGVRKFVVLGSYFTYFADKYPELRLTKNHIYIRTREEQRAAVLKEAGPGFDTFILELPYILGTLKGRVPPWTFIFSMLAGKGKRALFFTKGGTAAVTARQVGQAAIGAMEKGMGGKAYPLGGKNYAWTDFAEKYFEVTGQRKKLSALFPVIFKAFGMVSSLILRIQGKERGLDIGTFGELQYRDAFIDPDYSMRALGYAHDDYDGELSGVIKEWVSMNEKERKRPDFH